MSTLLTKGVLYRGKFMAEIFQYPPEWFVFLDETSSDHKDHILVIDWSENHQFIVASFGRGTRTSAIAALSNEGLSCYELITGATRYMIFLEVVYAWWNVHFDGG